MEAAGDGQVVAEALYLHAGQAEGVGHARGALSADGGGGAVAADDDGGDEADDAVHEARVEKGAGERSAALDEEAGDLAASEFGEQRGQVNAAIGGGRGEYVRSGGFER